MGANFSTRQFAGGATGEFKRFMQTGDDAGQALLITLTREEGNIRLQVEERRKRVKALADKGNFELGDDDANPNESAESVVTDILKLERFRDKALALRDQIIAWHALYKCNGGGGGTYNSPRFRITTRRVAQTLANLRADEVYQTKQTPAEWEEPLIIEDRLRTYCDMGGDQGHQADPIPNGIEYAETDPPFETEDYQRVFGQASVTFSDEDAKQEPWLGGGPVKPPTFDVRKDAYV